MRFGGHETFAVREGWLHKGMKLLKEDLDKFRDPDVADWLGVGRNMGKSIKYWLLATGLADLDKRHGRDMSLKVSELGNLVFEHDPYFLQAGTWWALHVELANCQEHAVTWWWFFNQFSLTRFDRAVCLTNLRAHLELAPSRVPAQKTLQRDIACLIASYATPIPAEIGDAEDADDCPFRELGIMTYSRATGACSLNTGLKPIPAELLGYAVARAPFLVSEGEGNCEITIREAATREGGPGKVFVMGADVLFELALRAEQELGHPSLTVAGLGAERTLRIARLGKPVSWLEAYYHRILECRHAA